jgi:hypothetical protein
MGPKIVDHEIDGDKFETLRNKAWSQRKEHISGLLAGKNSLFDATMF